MTKQVLEIKKLAYYFCAWAFTFANFLAFLVSRDHDRIHNPGQAWMDASATDFRTYPASEFERTLSCHGLGQCQRIGGALIFQPLIFLADSISKFYYWNVDDQSRIFIIQMVGLGWRIVCFTILGLCIYRFSKNISFVLFFTNALFFALSGWLLRIVGNLAQEFPSISDEFKMRSILAFHDFPYENFKWYDFGLFAAIGIIAVLIIQFSQQKLSLLQLFFLGLILTSFFEYLGFVFAFAYITYQSRYQVSEFLRKKNIALVILSSSATWIVLVAGYQRLMQSAYPKFFGIATVRREALVDRVIGSLWAIQHPIENLTSNPSIIFQILLVNFQCALLGLVTGYIARHIIKSVQIEINFVSETKQN